VIEVQDATPVTPVIVQVPVPVGATAPVTPVTVVVKTMVDPRVPVPALAETLTVGVAGETVVIAPDVGEVAE